MKKIISFFIIGLFIVSSFATISLSKENKEYITEEIKIELKKPLIKNNIDSSEIKIQNTNAYTMEPGKPILPCYKKTFKFSVGTNIKEVNVEIKNKEKIKLYKDIKIAPQPVKMKTLSQENIEKENKVDLKKTYPEKEYFYNIGRGIENEKPTLFLTVQVNPCSYDPIDNTVTVGKNIKISVAIDNEKEKAPKEGKYNFLIITPQIFNEETKPLQIHKENRGISTKLVTLEDISNEKFFTKEGRDEIEQIKYFIKNAYDNWGTRNVLIVGGNDYFPARNTHIKIIYTGGGYDDEQFISDLYYADIYDSKNKFCSWDSNENNIFAEINQDVENDSLDLYPDVKIGRLACTNNDQVELVVNKIINYESSKAWTNNWFNDIVVIGGDTVTSHMGDDSNIDEGELVNQVIINVMDGFLPDKIWWTNGKLGGISPSGVNNINKAINDGCGFIDWSGHGSESVWTTYPHNGRRQILPSPIGAYTNTMISDLDNKEKLPIVVCGGCSLGKYLADDNCFSWAFLSNPNGGGIASFGATAYGYIYLGEWATFGLIEGIGIRLFESYVDGSKTLGEMWSTAYNEYINFLSNHPDPDIYFGSADYKTLAEFHMFGDPTLQIRSDSNPPEKPANLSGPKRIKRHESYNFRASTTDEDNEQVYYLFDWGDQSYSEWLGPYDSGESIKTTNSWEKGGNYEIRVKAKDINGVQGEWSDPLSISVPKTKIKNQLIIEQIFNIIERVFPRYFIFFQS